MKICTLLVFITQVLTYGQPFLQWERFYDGHQLFDKDESLVVEELGINYMVGNSYTPINTSNNVIGKFELISSIKRDGKNNFYFYGNFKSYEILLF